MKPIKSREHDEIFDVEEENGKKVKHWIANWDTWKYLGYSDDVEAECDIIPFETLRDDYEVGVTKVVKTVTEIREGEKPREIFYPEGSHKTDRLYKMLYVCPMWSHNTNPNWLDEIEAVGFNVIHSYESDKYPWDDKFMGKLFGKLKSRNMWGCFQLPHAHIEEFIEGMAKYDNAILSSVEEPDGAANRTSKEEQKRIYDLAHAVGLPVWGCLDWGPWEERVNFEAFDGLIPNSYPYSIRDGSVPIVGTPAVGGHRDQPQWSFAPKMYEKFEMMHRVVPKNMPIINIGQGYYEGNNVYPNIEEEWRMYNKEFGCNSFAVYPHGIGQKYTTTVMGEERIKAQCKELMRKLDEGTI